MADDLVRRLKGKLKTGSDRKHVMDGVHIEPERTMAYGGNLNDLIGSLAATAGYRVGEDVEYEIRVKRVR